MSDPIETLMKEHRLIERVLDSLDLFSAGLSGGSVDERLALESYAEFFRAFADHCHHGKEEKLLFEKLKEHGMPAESGPLAVMRQEHEVGRSVVRELRAIADGRGALTIDELDRARKASAEYVGLLRAHIQKEDNVLFALARRMLPAAVLSDLAGRFTAFERNEISQVTHERMHRLAESLISSSRGDGVATGARASGGGR